jgi:hypothetical protein
MHTCALVRVGALEHARRVPRFGSGRTAARCHDAVGCAGDRRGQKMERVGEPGNEHEKRWSVETG